MCDRTEQTGKGRRRRQGSVFAKIRESQREAQLLTVSVVEDYDAPLFGLSLLWVHHGSANDKIN